MAIISSIDSPFYVALNVMSRLETLVELDEKKIAKIPEFVFKTGISYL